MLGLRRPRLLCSSRAANFRQACLGELGGAGRLAQQRLRTLEEHVAEQPLVLGEDPIQDAQHAALGVADLVDQAPPETGQRAQLQDRLVWQVALDQGKLLEAIEHITTSLDLVRESGRVAESLWPLRVAARLPATAGEPARAVALFAAEAAWRHSLGQVPSVWTLWAVPDGDEDVAALRAAQGGDAFDVAWTRGSTSSLDAAIGLARDAVQTAASSAAVSTI